MIYAVIIQKQVSKIRGQFYVVYSKDQIDQTMSDQFPEIPKKHSERQFYLSWSHYLQLMRIDNIDERHFYEIEAVQNDWSLAELKRQYNSEWFERLALSKDKEKVFELPEY